MHRRNDVVIRASDTDRTIVGSTWFHSLPGVVPACGERAATMSYMRGRHYLWRDDERLHLWAAGGYDGWDDSIWASGAGSDKTCAEHRASGVAIPTDVIDELVVMRLAELISEGTVAAAIERACAKHKGNGGCEVLAANAAGLVAVLRGTFLHGTGPARDANDDSA